MCEVAEGLLFKNELANLDDAADPVRPGSGIGLTIGDISAAIREWRGSPALRIESGLVIVSGLDLESGRIEVEVGVEGSAYPGIAFRIADRMNFELAYSQPHTSGGWDALQYDPVFHGSNTWQLHHGPRYQKEAVIPTGKWYSMRLDFSGDKASLSVDNQPPLTVRGLAHSHSSGMVGLWTFQPAYFRNLKVYSDGLSASSLREAQAQEQGALRAHTVPHHETVREWFLEGIGAIKAEPNGLVLLNRYLPSYTTRAVVTRKFELTGDARVEFKYGYSDVFSLAVDDVTIFSGSNTYSGSGDRDARGYVEPYGHTMAWDLKAGIHTIKAVVGVTESFGWGFGLSVSGGRLLKLLPVWVS